MRSLQVWGQTPIICLNNVNWLVFVMKTECVYCEAGNNVYIVFIRTCCFEELAVSELVPHWHREETCSAQRRCFLCCQFANELLSFERVCSSRLRFWTAHWSDRSGNNTSQRGVSLRRPGCCTTRTVKATRRPRDVTTGHVRVSRERKDYNDGRTACLSVSAVWSLDGYKMASCTCRWH